MTEHTCNPNTWEVKEDFGFETILGHKARPFLKNKKTNLGPPPPRPKEVVYLSGYRGRGQGHVDHLSRQTCNYVVNQHHQPVS